MRVYHTDGYLGVLVDYKEFTYHIEVEGEVLDYDLSINLKSDFALKILIDDLKQVGFLEV